MNYEQKYNEILEWARKNKARLNGVPIEEVLPELAESEDERIREWLVNYFETISKNWLHDHVMPLNSILAWLEKQKENPKNADSISADCISPAKCEERWHKVQDSLPDNSRLVLAKDCLANILLARYDGENWEVSVYDNEDYYCRNTITKWCNIPMIGYKESLHIPESCKENADSLTDEDERIRSGLIRYLESDRDYQPCQDISFYEEAIAWLEKQQKPEEWSEEDEEMLEYIIGDVNDAKQLYTTQEAKNMADKEIAWLKSIKPQNSNNISITPERLKELRDRSFEDGRKAGIVEMAKSMPMPEDTVLFQKGVKEGRRLEREEMWKPSEEQMDALIYAMQVMNTDLSPIAARTYQGLQEIHQNLKKL